MRLIVLAPLLALCLIGTAMAADAMPAPTSLADIGGYGIATALCSAIAYGAWKLFGLKLDQSHRESLHATLTTAASLIISLGTELLAKGVSPTEARQIVLQRGLDYVRQAAPDAIARFKLVEDARLLDMLKAKEVQLQLASPSPNLAPALPAVSA